MRSQKDRAVDELIGLCRGVLADGSIVQPEAEYLRRWLAGHMQFVREYPFNLLAERICDALGDDELDSEEERDLVELCQQITGNEHVYQPVRAATSASSALPLTESSPAIQFDGTLFALTGVFEYGPRVKVIQAIGERGGRVNRAITLDTQVLVIGNLSSPAWAHSTHGRKIELAATRGNILIVSEPHWASCL